MTNFNQNHALIYPAVTTTGGATSGYLVNSSYTYGSSGDAVACLFRSPVDQTSGNLTVAAYITADSSSASTFEVEIRNAATATSSVIPGTTVLGAAGSGIDLNGDSSSWQEFNATTGVTLTQGDYYWAIIKNSSGSPASDHATIATRAATELQASNVAAEYYYGGKYTSDGFATAASNQSGQAPFVIKFNDGTLLGNPYYNSESLASGTEWRGMRLTFTSDTVVSGFNTTATGSAFNAGNWAVYNGSTAEVSGTMSYMNSQSHPVFFDESFTCLANVAYDFVTKPVSSTTLGHAFWPGDASPPTMVTDCLLEGTALVYGSTPGSFTVATDHLFSGAAFIEQINVGGVSKLVGTGGLVG